MGLKYIQWGWTKNIQMRFFKADLKPGKTITTDFVFVIPDKYMKKKNYIYLLFDIFGLTNPTAEDIKIMKTSLGHE